MNRSRPVLAAVLLVAALPLRADHTDRQPPATPPAAAASTRFLVNRDGTALALGGYDPVAYFTDGKALPGDARFVATHEGATYRFTSAEHRALFQADPAKYAPAYGGYCGYAASIGKVRPTDPRWWSIVDGRLILQHTKGAAELWAKDVAGNKAKADRFWPRLVAVKAGLADPVDTLLGKSVLPEAR